MGLLPLKGITVIAIEQAVAAPFATRQLADLGARVIKIERPGSGDFARAYDTRAQGLASHFAWVNRSKESLTLNLKRPEAREVLARLFEHADVCVHNLAPGAAGRLGLDTEALRSRYPKLIVCQLTGYGISGPYAHKKAYDLLVQAEAGLLSITGTKDTPSKVGISIADVAGGMYAYTGVLTALLVRAQTGQGTAFEVSLFEALSEWMGYAMYYTMGGPQPSRTGASHAAIAPYGPYPARDGLVLFGIQNEREWERFCRDVLRRPDLVRDERFATNESRVQHRTELNAAIEDVFRELSEADVTARLDTAQIASARINSIRDLIDHPQLRARDAWREVGSPVGPIPALMPPVRMAAVSVRMDEIPALGQHSVAILKELGFDADRIDVWKSEGLI